MQYIPRYLVDNRITVIANEAGFVTEYKPVYSRQIKLYRGIDNTLQFKLINADQKPIDLSSYDTKFQAFDENNNLVISRNGTQVTDTTSTPIKGVFSVTITENDCLNLKDQFLSYNVYLVNSDDNNVLTYSNSHFEQSGTIRLTSDTFPGAKESKIFNSWLLDNNVYYSSAENAQPGINGNDALHTIAIYTDGYDGSITIQATLDNQPTSQTSWADIDTLTFTGNETEPKPVNFNGVYSHIRIAASKDPISTVTKILMRN